MATTGWRGTLLDNAFTAIEDFAAAQQLADSWDASRLHRKLDEFAQRYCPILKQIEESYHWSLDEAEYGRFTKRHALIEDSTFSIRTTKLSFWLLPVGNSLSMASTTKRCAPGSPNTTAAKCPGSCDGFARTGSSKRRVTAITT